MDIGRHIDDHLDQQPGFRRLVDPPDALQHSGIELSTASLRSAMCTSLPSGQLLPASSGLLPTGTRLPTRG